MSRRFGLFFSFVRHRDVDVCILLRRAHSRIAVNDIGNGEIGSYRLDVFDGALAKVSFKNACDQVGHNDIALAA